MPDDSLGPGPACYQGLAGFRLALRRFLAFSEATSRAAGLTAVQYQALLVIKAHPGGAIMMRHLAEEMLLQHHGAVQLVDRLERAALVTRLPSPDDRRSVLVGLTEAGEALLAPLAARHRRELLRYERLLAESLGRLREMGD